MPRALIEQVIPRQENRAPLVIAVEDDRSNLRGYLVIDSTVRGRAVGGLRMLPDVSLEETQALARTMTLKYAFAGLASGGAKAAVVGDPEMPAAQKHELLVKFFHALLPILQSRLYLPRPDMGTNQGELRRAAMAAGFNRSGRYRGLGDRSGLYTGFSVVGSALGALEFLRLPLLGCRVAIEGFGKVGSSAAQQFAAHGAKVVAVSTRCGAIYSAQGLDVAELRRLYDQHGSQLVNLYCDADRLSSAVMLELDVDVLAPCARFRSIHTGNAARIRAKLISSGANNPTTVEAERILREIGCLCLPDFVTSTGGMLGEAMEYAGLREDEIKDFIVSRFRARLGALLDGTKPRHGSLREFLEPILEARSRQIKLRTERPSVRSRFFRASRALRGFGLIPGFLARKWAPRYFDQRLLEPSDVL